MFEIDPALVGTIVGLLVVCLLIVASHPSAARAFFARKKQSRRVLVPEDSYHEMSDTQNTFPAYRVPSHMMNTVQNQQWESEMPPIGYAAQAVREDQEVLDYLDSMDLPVPADESPAIQEPVPMTPISVPVPLAIPTGMRRRKEYLFTIGYDVMRQAITFPMGHILIARNTRSGKSNIAGIIISQGIKQGVDVWYINAGYAPVDEDGLDISPLIDRCAEIAITPGGVEQVLMLRRAVALIEERSKLAIEQKIAYHHPVLVVVEELKALQARLRLYKIMKMEGFEDAMNEVSALLEIILSSGAKFNVNCLSLSQDAQSKTTGLSEGTQCNWEAKIAHPSLDRASLAKVLPKHMLGKGNRHELPKVASPHQWYVVRPDGNGSEQITVVDVPKLTNEDIVEYIRGIPPMQRTVPQENPKASGYLWTEGMKEAQIVEQPMRILEIPVRPETPVVPRPTVFWTEDHVKAAAWVAERGRGQVSNRGLAEHLYGKSDGRYNQRAGEILAHVCKVLDVDSSRIESEDEEIGACV